MRVVNVTNSVLALPIKFLTNIPAKTISRDVVMTRELIKTFLVSLANLYKTRVIFIVTDQERLKFNDIFSVFPLINLRAYSELVEYKEGDDIPPGTELVKDPFWFNPATGQYEDKYYLVLYPEEMSSEVVWEDMVTMEDYDKVRFMIGTQEEYNSLVLKDENILYFCSDSRLIYKGSTPYTAIKDIQDLANVIITVLEDLGMTDSDIPTAKAVVDYVNHRFDSIIGGVEYRGLLDPNNPTSNEYWINAKKGYLFRCSAKGTLNGIELGIGDTIIINEDATGSPTAEQMDIIPYTLDDIGDLKKLKTSAKDNLVNAINEIYDNLPFWTGIDK